MTQTFNLNTAVTIELFIMDPSTGSGKTGMVAHTALTIQRASDSKYWSGAAWDAARVELVVTEVSAALERGRYTYTIPAAFNAVDTRYIAHAVVNDPPDFTDVDSFEVYEVRDLSINLYELEPA